MNYTEDTKVAQFIHSKEDTRVAQSPSSEAKKFKKYVLIQPSRNRGRDREHQPYLQGEICQGDHKKCSPVG